MGCRLGTLGEGMSPHRPAVANGWLSVGGADDDERSRMPNRQAGGQDVGLEAGLDGHVQTGLQARQQQR